MEPGDIKVARTLAIDGALLADVLLRLRRDADGMALRWTLGGRGSAEVDVSFVAAPESWSAVARVWDPTGLAVAGIAIQLDRVADEVNLSIAPTAALTPAWQARLPELLDLVHALLDELSEELLWHASRVDVHP